MSWTEVPPTLHTSCRKLFWTQQMLSLSIFSDVGIDRPSLFIYYKACTRINFRVSYFQSISIFSILNNTRSLLANSPRCCFFPVLPNSYFLAFQTLKLILHIIQDGCFKLITDLKSMAILSILPHPHLFWVDWSRCFSISLN